MTTKTYSFVLEEEQYETLLAMAAWATKAAFTDGNKAIAFRFLGLVNKMNENNPEWTPYRFPEQNDQRQTH